jgi:hypothetical protein
MNLSKAQQIVVDKMREGWELGCGMDLHGHPWLQKNGCGRGGETIKVNRNTFCSLLSLGVIENVNRTFPLATYKLKSKEKTT